MPARSMLLIAHRGDLLAERLPVLQATLERQRDFRRAQLDVHEQSGRPSTPHVVDYAAHDPKAAVREVQALVEAGARHALDDIELALDRMRTGDYGHCRACGAGIDLAVIDAVPQTTMCQSCCRLL